MGFDQKPMFGLLDSAFFIDSKMFINLNFRNNDEDPEKARQRALQDPEVQEILRDPTMRVLLEQMSNDPGAVREHLQNPEILSKLLKLRDAGIVQMR